MAITQIGPYSQDLTYLFNVRGRFWTITSHTSSDIIFSEGRRAPFLSDLNIVRVAGTWKLTDPSRQELEQCHDQAMVKAIEAFFNEYGGPKTESPTVNAAEVEDRDSVESRARYAYRCCVSKRDYRWDTMPESTREAWRELVRGCDAARAAAEKDASRAATDTDV